MSECQIQLNTQESGDGFNDEIPKAILRMVNDWEDELCGVVNAVGCTLE